MDSRQKDKAISDELFAARKASYDAEAKNVLACRQVLAPVMKRTVTEFRDVSLKEIEETCIEGAPYVGVVPVEPGLTNEVWHAPQADVPPKIHGLPNESTEPKEGRVTFDVVFYARAPKKGRRIKIIINVEAQREQKDYPMMMRAGYYGCRLVSSQKGREFTDDHYENICKVYTIWICFYLPKGYHSTIAHYRFNETLDVGDYHEPKENYDLIDITMIHIGEDEKKDRLLAFLYTVFMERITREQKAKKLEETFGLKMDNEMREGMNRMCNLSDGLVDDAEARGAEKKAQFVILNLLKEGMKLSAISRVTGWTVEQVRSFIESQGLG